MGVSVNPTFNFQVSWGGAASGSFIIGTNTFGDGSLLGGYGPFSSGFTGANDTITADVKNATIQRGRDDNMDPMRSGTCTLVLHDPTGKYNPRNTASVLNGNLLPMRLMRVQCTFLGTTYNLFRGFIRSIEFDPWNRETTIICEDLFLWLARTFPVLTAVAGETTGSAIGRILDYLGFTDPALRSLATGDTLAASTFAPDGSTNALALIENLLESERGTFWITPAGVAKYVNRNYYAQQTVAATFTGNFNDSTFGVDVDRIVNRVKVSRTGGVDQSAQDSTSIGTYGYSDFASVQSDYLVSDALALSLAQWLVALRKDPLAPVRQFTVFNRNDSDYIQMLTREIGDRITATEQIGNSSGDFHVESIEHRIEEAGLKHTCNFGLSNRPTVQPFIIGASTFGDGTVLGY